MTLVDAEIVWSAIAEAILPTCEQPVRMGEVELRKLQREGVAQIMSSIEEFGGALLCDEVGVGKTYTGIAVMREFDSSTVIAPAVLLPMWADCLRQSGAVADLYSLESFSRDSPARSGAALVIIDEAHNLRNAGTKRFKAVARLATGSKVLLLSATPVHNSAVDLTVLLSLFLGSRAPGLPASDMARCMIRRRRSASIQSPGPQRQICRAANPPVSNRLLASLLALPDPIPPRDGESCSLLVRFTLLRQWASSDAALRGALQKRLARARALISALESGRYPTRSELEEWRSDDGIVQLAFAELLAAPGGDETLLASVRQHEKATRELLKMLDSEESSDEWRVNYLRSLRREYSGRKIVAFTQFASTARALYRLMQREEMIGLVTSGRCDIASGRVSRAEVLRRFAPLGCRAKAPPPRENITLLIATDLCSEGLNLQDAGVVVHLDLPWTTARLEQRVGRVARSGSIHEQVFIHTIRIPRIADEMLRVEQRLRDKGMLSSTLIGRTGGSGSDIPPTSRKQSLADANAEIHAALRRIGSRVTSGIDTRVPLVSNVESESSGFIALVADSDRFLLLCDGEASLSEDPRDILDRIRNFSGKTMDCDPLAIATALKAIETWSSQRRLTRMLGMERSISPSRRSILKQIQQIAGEHSRESTVRLSAVADSAWTATGLQYGASTENALNALAIADETGEQWLTEITALESLAHKTKAVSREASGFRLIALLIGSRA